ncbi:uncharacterized protein LOC124463065 [Scomber scombrus]|uniref:Uncharacterized protein LOC124463065 n=1 Tax=Scomber scombrus TaxID=13677 RepID=A0AAV1P0L4_SCOSC
MEKGDSSDDDVITDDSYSIEESNNTKGVRTHFWLERTYINEEGAEQWQTEQEISQKLWHLTTIVNLLQIEREFPTILWSEVLRRIWTPRILATILEQLCNNPLSKATIPLSPLLGIPEGLTLAGKSRGAVDPRLDITVIPRKVEWETSKISNITKTIAKDGTKDLRVNSTRGKTLKPGVTVGKIVVLVRTKEEGKPEIFRQKDETARGYMGAKMVKTEGVLTPLAMVVRTQPDHEKQIRLCMKKWHKRTSGTLQWPMEGTFEAARCNEIEANIKHHKAKNTSSSREGKRAREREVLRWFRQAARRHVLDIKQMPTLKSKEDKVTKRRQQERPSAPQMLAPPPYVPNTVETPTRQFPVIPVQNKMEGEMEGKIVIKWSPHNGTGDNRTQEISPTKKEEAWREYADSMTPERSMTNTSRWSLTGLHLANTNAGKQPTEGRRNIDSQTARREYEKLKKGRSPSENDRRRYQSLMNRPTHSSNENRRQYQQLMGEQESGSEEDYGLDNTDELLAIKPTPWRHSTPKNNQHYWPQEEEKKHHPLQEMMEQQLQEEEHHQIQGAANHRSIREWCLAQDSKGEEEDSNESQVINKVVEYLHKTIDKKKQLQAELTQVQNNVKELLQPETHNPKIKMTLTGRMESDDDKGKENVAQKLDKVQNTLTELVEYHTSQLRSNQEQRDTGITLRSGKHLRKESKHEEEEDQKFICPLITKTGQDMPQYIPWSFCDMIGLAGRLPDLNEGANKWITAFEESTAGVTLALGDIKALLMHVAGKHTAEEIFLNANLALVVTENQADHIGFNGFRGNVWTQVRNQYPEKMDPSKLEGEILKDGECPAKFLRTFQTKWREETGNVWNINDTTKSLFKVMVKKAMPQEVQKRLDNVVGLMKMEWPLFSEHLIHHVETIRKDKLREEEANKCLTNKLTQLQLQELSMKQKKDKMQAPMITMEQTPAQTTATMALQSPTGPSSQPQMQTPQTSEQMTATGYVATSPHTYEPTQTKHGKSL